VGKTQHRHLYNTAVGEAAFLPEFVTYAQNFEDVMLRRALLDIKGGFYVDVGAFHPVIHSLSCWFYQNGWTGINVEPNEKFFAALTAERPRDVNLRLAITGEPGIATLYLCDGLSTVREEVAAAHRLNGLDISQTAQVEAITLDQLFVAYVRSRTVDFLKLDVEGSESEILNSTSFDRIRPRVLIVEATKPDSREPTWHAWERGLLKKGYTYVWFDGVNRFYLREEDRWRRKFFKAPPSVFDSIRFAPNDPRIKFSEGQSVEALCLALDAARSQISSLNVEREQTVNKASTLERELEFARTDISYKVNELNRMVSVTGHLERAVSAALDKLWKLSGEIETLVQQKVETEGELQAARGENSRLIAERHTLIAENTRAEGELQAARSENSGLVAERDRLTVELDALANDNIRIESEFEAVRSENSRLLAEHKLEKSRLERELEAARRDNPRLVAERDRLTVEIARYQIKQRAHTELVAERDRLVAETARWFEAAVAAAYARRLQPEGPARHLKVMITASGRRLKCSISRSRWERGPRMSLALADRALNERQWQLAARIYGDVLEHWPTNAAVWVQFGHAIKESGRVVEAEAVYRHAIQLTPAIADFHLQLGHALKLQSRPDAAIEAYAAALSLDPGLQHAADELTALGWTTSDIEMAKSHDLSAYGRRQIMPPQGKSAMLALQRMFQ
jgi:FkbM family methyltransferase